MERKPSVKSLSTGMYEKTRIKRILKTTGGYLFGGFEASRGHRHRFGEPLAMEVAPIFCEDGSGELARIVVTFVFNKGQDKGEVWREISIEVPTGETWDERHGRTALYTSVSTMDIRLYSRFKNSSAQISRLSERLSMI